jgi:signal transduction histidine kinase/CheY-like chemotaxis protein
VRAPAPADPLRAVIVDDTEDLRELLRMALVRGGMSVVAEAGDGRAGIEAVRTGRPDVILLDLSMPVMDGLEALPVMRALAPEARIIVLSGFGASHMSERAMALGADGYLQKGASLGRILDHIRDLVDGRAIDPVGHAGGAPAALVPVVVAPPSPTDPWDAIALAPFGVIEVDTESPYRILRLNPAAAELLDDRAIAGVPLIDAAPSLAETVAGNRLRGDIEFESAVSSRPVEVTVRHTSSSLLLYLRAIADEVGLLRSAIATTAHEIRGPVSVLCAVAETIQDAGAGDLDAAQHARLMSSIARQSRMLDSITADLLTAAQIQRGTLRIDAHDVDPLAVLDVVIADRYPGTVTVEAHDRRMIVADPLRLEQMLGNLLSNAHKYGAAPVLIRVRPSTEHRNLVCLDVCDSGDGVPPEFQAHLFREFSRASTSAGQRRAAAGTGLGLHVVRTLAQAQGGSVSYGSAPGGGATFTLTMPAART